MTVKWMSHRGESLDAPENSLAAFKLSLERNTDGMECDVRMSSDGVAVVSHDDSTARMGDKALIVGESSFQELSSVNISGAKTNFHEMLPDFASTLDYLGDREYYVELEADSYDMLHEVKKSIDRKQIPFRQIVLISFYKGAMIKSKEIMPHAKRLWLTTLRDDDNNIITSKQLVDILNELGVDGVDALSDEKIIDAEYVKAVKDQGFYFAVWTIDQLEQAKRFISYGVDSITSNCAYALKKIVNETQNGS